MSNDFRIFSIPLTSASKGSPQESLGIKIKNTPNIKADNLFHDTWGSSIILAEVLHEFDAPTTPHESHVLPVLEIGAGTGLAGLAAAVVWQTDVLMTDLAPILPGVQANIDLNTVLLKQHGGSATCTAYDWNEPDRLEAVGIADTSKPPSSPSSSCPPAAMTILAADTVYDEAHPHLLSRVVAHRLHRSPDARFLIAYPLRVAYLDHIRALWAALEARGLKANREGRGMLPVEWDDERQVEWVEWVWKEG